MGRIAVTLTPMDFAMLVNKRWGKECPESDLHLSMAGWGTEAGFLVRKRVGGGDENTVHEFKIDGPLTHEATEEALNHLRVWHELRDTWNES